MRTCIGMPPGWSGDAAAGFESDLHDRACLNSIKDAGNIFDAFLFFISTNRTCSAETCGQWGAKRVKGVECRAAHVPCTAVTRCPHSAGALGGNRRAMHQVGA